MNILSSHTHPCHEAYSEGLLERRPIRMLSGALYKIKEAERRLATKDNLTHIGRYACGDQTSRYKIRHCIPEEIEWYTQQIPSFISKDLGYCVLGVLHGLKGDGLSKSDISRIETKAQEQIGYLLALGEIASIELNKDWKSASIELAEGGGAMHHFVAEVLALLDWVMTEVELCKPRS
tara:strand:- start:131 stop:664 length:534 start_codon:yes stop_codon:yes gene_type:complete